MSTNARIYVVTTGVNAHLVEATSQAQAMRRVALDLMSCRPAHSLDVANMLLSGVRLLEDRKSVV